MNLRSCETQKITCKPPHYIRDGTQSSPSVAMHQIQRTLNVPANLQRPPNPIPEINNKHATCDLILFHFIIPQRQKKRIYLGGFKCMYGCNMQLACMSMHQIDNVSTVNKVLCQYLNFCRKMFSLCLTCLYMLLNICNVIHISTSLTVQYFFFWQEWSLFE